MPVFVHARIEPAARSAFEAAARDDERVGGVTEDQETGALDVHFELPGGGVDRAFNEARGLYRRIVESAGLTLPQHLQLAMSGFEALMVQASRDRQLLDRARDLLDEEEYDLAVILAQTACEVLAADTLRNLLQPHISDELQPWLLSRVRTFTFMDDSTRELWTRLTGSRIQVQDFWQDYKEHVRRRHSIVHRGERVDESAARSSVDVAIAFFAYLERMIGTVPSPLQ